MTTIAEFLARRPVVYEEDGRLKLWHQPKERPMSTYPAPRNTMVLVRELKKSEERVGNIVVPEMNARAYMTAEILAVGPGLSVLGGKDAPTETQDLKVGQRVWLKAKEQAGPRGLINVGIETKVNGEMLWLFEQMNILMILDEPGEWSPIEDETPAEEPNDSPIITG